MDADRDRHSVERAEQVEIHRCTGGRFELSAVERNAHLSAAIGIAQGQVSSLQAGHQFRLGQQLPEAARMQIQLQTQVIDFRINVGRDTELFQHTADIELVRSDPDDGVRLPGAQVEQDRTAKIVPCHVGRKGRHGHHAVANLPVEAHIAHGQRRRTDDALERDGDVRIRQTDAAGQDGNVQHIRRRRRVGRRAFFRLGQQQLQLLHIQHIA